MGQESISGDDTGARLLKEFAQVARAAQECDDGKRCMIPPHPDLRERLKKALLDARGGNGSFAAFTHISEPNRPGFNDGLIIPPESFPLGTSLSVIRSAAADSPPLRGIVRVIVVLVDFSDKPMVQAANHFHDLFFSTGVIPTKSVREYYAEVTHGLIDIQGDVVGPFRMPMTLAQYANGLSGIGGPTPNATTMARDALRAADPTVNFAPFDNNGDGYVDAFIVIHAGSGAEQTGSSGDIWSHKSTLDGGAVAVDGTHVFGYLTVPEDCRIGVCCHELGHLLYGFPDLYDTDYSSEGIGNWCLMSAGSWGGAVAGDTPTHPSAWCKANQGWASVDNRTTNAIVSIPDVKDSNTVYRLWKGGGASSEYFLLENRQQTRFDQFIPGPGLLIWHIDESVATNTNENHYKVALLQADGKRDLELNHNRGDAGDVFPGSANNVTFNATSTPNSKSYGNVATCVSVSAITASSAVMSANIQVSCLKHKDSHKEVVKDIKDVHKEHKDKEKEKEFVKEIKDSHKDVKDKEKEKDKEIKDGHKEIIDKHIEKPLIDKASALDKGLGDKTSEGRPGDGGGGLGGVPGSLEARVAALETRLSQGAAQAAPQPFIGAELRPDLRRGALSSEEDLASAHQQLLIGSAQAKRQLDSKPNER